MPCFVKHCRNPAARIHGQGTPIDSAPAREAGCARLVVARNTNRIQNPSTLSRVAGASIKWLLKCAPNTSHPVIQWISSLWLHDEFSWLPPPACPNRRTSRDATKRSRRRPLAQFSHWRPVQSHVRRHPTTLETHRRSQGDQSLLGKSLSPVEWNASCAFCSIAVPDRLVIIDSRPLTGCRLTLEDRPNSWRPPDYWAPGVSHVIQPHIRPLRQLGALH
jgi:hypothetical protein